MFDHLGFTVADFDASRAFYVAALAPLGVSVAMEFDGRAGMGRDGRPQFWFGASEKPVGPLHLAFTAATANKCARSMRRRFRRALKTMAGRGCAPTTIRTITARL
jgi:catechol 2,3-dioxygenase-like lactoylglutathione lyase family enzyme